jgi:hypothetical protein
VGGLGVSSRQKGNHITGGLMVRDAINSRHIVRHTAETVNQVSA